MEAGLLLDMVTRGQAENLQLPVQLSPPPLHLGHRTGAAHGQFVEGVDKGDTVHSVEGERGPQMDLEPGFTKCPLTLLTSTGQPRLLSSDLA